MLPNLSTGSNWGTGLQLMVPMQSPEPVGPTNVLGGRNALLELKQIQSICVSFSGIKGRYVLEVFTDSHDIQAFSSEPSIESEGPSARSERPTARVDREFHEFTNLRDDIFNVVHLAHRRKQCELCEDLLDWSVFGVNPDGMLLPLQSGERVARKFTKFMTKLLERTIQRSSTNTQGSCSGQILVPQILHAFLYGGN